MASGFQFSYTGSDEIYDRDCDVCLSNDKTSEAISFCSKCIEHLCQSCDKAHRGSKATRGHPILTGCNIPLVSTTMKPTLPIMFCDTHKTTLLDSYCTTHEQVICPACKMTNHTTCNTGDVSRHSAKIDLGKELQIVVNRLRDLTNKYDNFTKNRDTDKSTVMSQIQNCLIYMQQVRNDINDKLNKLENEMSSEIRQMGETLKTEIEGQVTLADGILEQIRDLNTSLSECVKSREDDVMFVGLKKASLRAGEYGDIIDEIQKHIYPIKICFQPNDVLSDMIQQLQSLGTVANNRPSNSGSKQASIQNIICVKKKGVNKVTADTVQGCTFMSNGHAVLSCGDNGLKLFDENFFLKTQLPVSSGNVSTINDTDVIVSQGNLKQLQRVRIFPGMVVNRTLKMDRNCYGLDVYGDQIYVTCHDRPGNGEVRVINMDGTIDKRLGVDNGKFIFTRPENVQVNRDGKKIFVSDFDTHTVTCLNNHGHEIYRYSSRDLKSPVGMYVDGKDNLLVCGLNSHNVHMIRQDGKKEKNLLSEKDGIHHPVCVSVRPSDGCLVVGLHPNAKTDQKLIIFSTR